MANLGQAALIIGGTVVGALIGGPVGAQIGFALGGALGSVLSPTQLPGQSGPRLSDGQTTTSVVGSPVSILFGTAPLSGTFMWISPITEHTNTQTVGGKGGPTQTNTSYTYTQSVAIGLCEGPIGGISRVWENGTLVYDIRNQQAGESDTDYANRLTVAAVYAETFTLHLGDEEQVVDATIESIEGMGNVPGFRGLAYLVFPDRKLLETQALRHPSFKIEAFQSGAGGCVSDTQYSNQVLFPWINSGNPTNPLNSNTFMLRHVDARSSPPAYGGLVFSTLEDALSTAEGYLTKTMGSLHGYRIAPYANRDTPGPQMASIAGDTVLTLPKTQTVLLCFNNQEPQYMDRFYNPGWSVFDGGPNPFNVPGAVWWQDAKLFFTSNTIGGDPQPSPHTPFYSASHGTYWYDTLDDVEIYVIRAPNAPADPCNGFPAAPIPGYAVRGDGKWVKCGAWLYDDSQEYNVLKPSVNPGGDNDILPPLNPCLPATSPLNTEAFWTTAYDAAVTAGDIAAGLTYSAGGEGGPTHFPIRQAWGYSIDMTVCEGSGDGVTLGTIIRAICARSGLTDVDASDMDAVTVDGYAVSTVSAGRDILTPLRSVGFFDCVESGSTLKFVARGKPIVASLGLDDFGAYDGGATGGTPGPSITTSKAQDADLPLQARAHYFATSRDYEDGEQLSPTRLTTTAVNVVDIELAVCMDDTQAAKIVDVLWSTAWAERWSGTLAVDQAWSELEPGDCIEVPVDGVTRRIRIVSENVAAGVLRTFNYVRDDDGAYISHAVAEAPLRQPQKLRLLSSTDLELLDLPALVDSDNNAGFYAAAAGSTLSGNAWNGCVIFKSADGGATFSQLGSVTTAATIGTLQAAVTPSDWHAWDTVTTITVNVPAGVTFESRTDAAVLTGANSAAMGANGRWEIVQFATATQFSPTQWQLSRLLRGRRGTEHNIASSQTGDKFVMISTGALVRIPLQTSEIGANRVYKAVSIGASYASGIDQTFAGQGMALRPFSPVHLTAERDTSGDIVLNWTRRGRLGRTWMSGVDIPLSEATESYSVDIFSPDSPHTVVRTIATSTPTAVYTAAHQSTDFGSDSGTHLMVAVYQISATVGRGFPDIQNLLIS